MNGAGKSFIMKFAWFSGYALQLYKTILLVNPTNTDKIFKEELQNLFRYTFDQAEELTGSIMIYDKDEEIYRFVLSFDEGALGYFNMDILDASKFNMNQISAVSYNSKEARTFNQTDRYHRMKARFGITVLDKNAMEELTEFFRIYDILWYEQVLAKVQSFDKGEFDSKLNDVMLRSVVATLFNDIGVTDIKAKPGFPWVPIFHMDDGTTRDVLVLSAGSQAMLMMTAFA
jgi:hypothetical protein